MCKLRRIVRFVETEGGELSERERERSCAEESVLALSAVRRGAEGADVDGRDMM